LGSVGLLVVLRCLGSVICDRGLPGGGPGGGSVVLLGWPGGCGGGAWMSGAGACAGTGVAAGARAGAGAGPTAGAGAGEGSGAGVAEAAGAWFSRCPRWMVDGPSCW
jgi:hypothetical protein